jgi:hypothetical protein
MSALSGIAETPTPQCAHFSATGGGPSGHSPFTGGFSRGTIGVDRQRRSAAPLYPELRAQVDAVMNRGGSLEDVEGLIEPLDTSAELKDALWLYAWSHEGHAEEEPRLGLVSA